MPLLPLPFLPFFALFCAPSHAWSLYEECLQIGQTSPNGFFEFELKIESKLSMSSEHDHGDLSIHDYEADQMVWTERKKDQLRPCQEYRQLLSVAPPMSQKNQSSIFYELALNTEQSVPDLIQLNGRHRRLNAVNGQSPGPTLVVKDGSEVLVRVENRLLLESVSLHFHGQTMDNRWYHDGVAPLQQCPIDVRSDLAIRFTAQSVGTHFYRGHLPSGHQSNGLVGAFVVLPKDGERQQMQFDKDYVAMLQDLPLVPSGEQTDQFEEGSAEFVRGMHGDFDGAQSLGKGEEDGTWSILINSKGWHSREHIRRKPNNLQWTTFAIDKGDIIRFRLIHAGVRHPLVVHIEQHRMEVIATDGSEVEPFATDALIIYPGERFDVRVNALAHPRWPAYRMVVGLAEQLLAEAEGEPIYGLANLAYHPTGEAIESNWDGGRKVDFQLSHCTAHRCVLLGCPFRGISVASGGRKFACHSVDELRNRGKTNDAQRNDGTPSAEHGNDEKAVESHRILLDSEQMTADGFRFQMPAAVGPFSMRNGGQIAEALRQGNCSNCKSNATLCDCFHFKRFPQGKTIKLTLINNGSPSNANFGIKNAFRRSLSVHLHGIRFDVLRIAAPELLRNGSLQKYNDRNFTSTKNAMVRKDTVLVPYGGQTVISFYTENLGWWLAETQQNGRGSINFAFAIGEDDQMPKAPDHLPSDCNFFDPGTEIYTNFLRTNHQSKEN